LLGLGPIRGQPGTARSFTAKNAKNAKVGRCQPTFAFFAFFAVKKKALWESRR